VKEQGKRGKRRLPLRRQPILTPIAVYDCHDPTPRDQEALNAWARSQGLHPELTYRWEVYRTDHLWARAYEYAAEPDGTLIWDPAHEDFHRAAPYDQPITTLPPDLWMVELPWGLPLLSANDRIHHRVRAEYTRSLRTAAAAAAKAARLPTMQAAHVIGEYQPGHRARRRDAANWCPSFKAAADGLVDAGVLDDDDASRMVGPDPRLGPPDPDAALAGVRWGRVVLYLRARVEASDLI
jgi:crossover junction endodeoxyribonuclease RusA